MENMMRAVVYREKGCFALEERPVPEILRIQLMDIQRLFVI